MDAHYYPGAAQPSAGGHGSSGRYGSEQALMAARGRTISEGGNGVPPLSPFALSLAAVQQRSLPNLYTPSPEHGLYGRPTRDPSSPESEPDMHRPRAHARQRSQSFTHATPPPTSKGNPLAHSLPRPTLPFLPARIERLHASIPSPHTNPPRSQSSPRNSSPRTSSPRNSPRNLAKSEKRFPCPVPTCESGYARRTVLLRHFSTKHSQLYHLYPEMKPDEIACPVSGCSSTFLRKGNLIHHYRRFHPDMTYNQHSAFKWTVDETGSEGGNFEYDFSEGGDFSDDNMDLSGSRRSSDFNRQFHGFTLDESSILPEHPFENETLDSGAPLPMLNAFGPPVAVPHYAHMAQVPQDFSLPYSNMASMTGMDFSYKRENEDERPEMYQDPLNEFNAQIHVD